MFETHLQFPKNWQSNLSATSNGIHCKVWFTWFTYGQDDDRKTI